MLSLIKEMNSQLRTLAMPISGRLFVNQIWLAMVLISVGYKPDIILGTSGGCITGVLLLLCGVNSVRDRASYCIFKKKVWEILALLDSKWYLSEWSSNLLVSRVIGMQQGSLFDRGYGESLINDIEVDLNCQPEMWIGTRDRTQAKHQLFCTRSRASSTLKMNGAIYANGDVQLITKASIASCAVPTIVPGIRIGESIYCDGGLTHASPLGPCASAYQERSSSSSQEESHPYHVVYISPARYNNKDDPCTQEIEDDDVWNQLASSTAGITGRSLHIPDRNNGIRMVGPNPKKTVGQGKCALQRALQTQECSERSFIEITPCDPVHLNFITMKRGEAVVALESVYGSDEFTVRHWYI